MLWLAELNRLCLPRLPISLTSRRGKGCWLIAWHVPGLTPPACSGDLGYNLRYVASAVSHVFIAFGELLQVGYPTSFPSLVPVSFQSRPLELLLGLQSSWSFGRCTSGCKS